VLAVGAADAVSGIGILHLPLPTRVKPRKDIATYYEPQFPSKWVPEVLLLLLGPGLRPPSVVGALQDPAGGLGAGGWGGCVATQSEFD
jgi:hypothetical protein